MSQPQTAQTKTNLEAPKVTYASWISFHGDFLIGAGLHINPASSFLQVPSRRSYLKLLVGFMHCM